jgi:UDP-N-acetylglucosamine--N-acetylmuramyl-(pentapeptide) pyrophosphoryl-undecaprenol N-acetylglucosamine transferase
VPLVVHEQNSRAGLANRLLSRWAAATATSFPKTEGLKGRAVLTGLPLREEIVPGDAAAARRKLELDPGRFTVLVFGGSQGARALNGLLRAALPELSNERDRWQFVHFTGEAGHPEVSEAYRAGGWKAFVRPYWPDMAAAYAAADFVVSRSGANTVMELARLGKRALLVPFPFATDDHQRGNAEHLRAQGLAEVVLEKDLTPARLASILKEQPSAAAGKPDPSLDGAAERVAKLVDDVVRERTGG